MTQGEEGGFYEEIPEDYYAEEELMLGALSKCRKIGSKKKRKKPVNIPDTMRKESMK